ncbi:MAG: hypothetical protein OEV62_09625, partial [Actinomycetota bacterium]|nr:hypothetical protein [Actinomycetota bacterium]
GFEGGAPGPMRTPARRGDEASGEDSAQPAAPAAATAAADSEAHQRIELPETRERKTIVFEDSAADDLDVPDFLK